MLYHAENVPREGAVVAIFDEPVAAEGAIRALERDGFPMDRLSLVGRDDRTEDHVIGYASAGDRVKFWGRRGAYWGAVAGVLPGAALLLMPGVGHVFVFGPLAHWIMTGLEGGAMVGGVSALGAGLVSLGVPRNALAPYETAVRDARFLVVATGTARELDQARGRLRRTSPAELHDYARAPLPA